MDGDGAGDGNGDGDGDGNRDGMVNRCISYRSNAKNGMGMDEGKY